MMSPCDTTAKTASSPRRAHQSRTAATARTCMSRIASPPSPGNVMADGWDCTTFHSGSLASFFSSWPDQSPYRTSPTRSSTWRSTGRAPRACRSVVSRHRCSGLVTTAASGSAGQPGRERPDLLAPGVVEGDPLGPAGEDAGAVRGGPAVADEQHGGHDGELYETAPTVRRAAGTQWLRDRRLRPLPPRQSRARRRRPARGAARSRGPGVTASSGSACTTRRPSELEKVAKEFALHPLAVEDAVKAHQRPKVEDFDDSLFVVLKTVRYDEATQQVDLGDVMLFLGDSFIVSVRHGQGRALGGVRARLEKEEKLLDCGPSAVLYAVCDAIVDDYSEIAYAVEQDIDEVEERVFSAQRSNEASRIYNLKREVIEFRRGVRPLVEPDAPARDRGDPARPRAPAAVLPRRRRPRPPGGRAGRRVRRPADLGPEREPGPGRASSRTRTCGSISAWVAIAAVPTAIAGIYGHELRVHAGAALARRVSSCPCPDGRDLCRSVPSVQAQRMVVSRFTGERQRTSLPLGANRAEGLSGESLPGDHGQGHGTACTTCRAWMTERGTDRARLT